jgi:hypothetical protein
MSVYALNKNLLRGVSWLVYYVVAHLLHARTVEAQKQPLLSNTRTQQ